MTGAAFKTGMSKVYAAHAKAPPSQAVLEALWERVGTLPDAFMHWAARQLCDYEKLPQNLGLELAGRLYPRWRAQNRTGSPHQPQLCPDCDPQTPGFFHWWRRDGQTGRVTSGLCRCLCNNNPALDPMPRKSKAQAAKNGLSVMPRGYRGGPAAFDKEISKR